MRQPIDKTDRIYMFMTGFGCLLYFIAFVVLAIGCFMVSFDLIITSLIIGVIGGGIGVWGAMSEKGGGTSRGFPN